MFAAVTPVPPDAILGLSLAYAADTRSDKIDLGVGVYRTIEGETPVMAAVKKAEAFVIDHQNSKRYTPPEGAPGFTDNILKLVFGDADVLQSGRAAAVQAPGGCGALRLAADLLNRFGAKTISTGAPTWANHKPLMGAAGFDIQMLPYYDAASSSIDFDAYVEAVKKLGPSDVLLIHNCCHNPTGADLSTDQIDILAQMAKEQGFFPLIDAAYHGFAQDLEKDAYMIRAFADQVPEVLVTYSCSKNFGLYRERVGALIVVSDTAERALAIKSHALNIARANYSMPPAHGGAIVSEILGSPELSKMWRDELAAMSGEVRGNRQKLVAEAEKAGLGNRLSYITNQHGMFSLLPLNEEEVVKMRVDHGVYIVGGGRINMCGVNHTNVERLVAAFKAVTQS
ncbi:aromatic amino acid transaminase [Hyphococcus sp. DH-69]|uniref:amino acid aminotransferase n=1 Tax=Hyphococcus formosus TaxID=3143534 RepID=UPI00398AAF0F